MQFFFSYYTLQLILIYFVARDSPERSNLIGKLLSTRFSTSLFVRNPCLEFYYSFVASAVEPRL